MKRLPLLVPDVPSTNLGLTVSGQIDKVMDFGPDWELNTSKGMVMLLVMGNVHSGVGLVQRDVLGQTLTESY